LTDRTNEPKEKGVSEATDTPFSNIKRTMHPPDSLGRTGIPVFAHEKMPC
jgi:hypothetical protein